MFRQLSPLAVLTGVLALCVTPALALDVFDRHGLTELRELGKSGTSLPQLAPRQAAELKMLGPGFTSPAIVVRTDMGNWTKALVSWGLRKGADKPLPVLMIDRYVTLDATRPGVTASSGKDVMLFAGFGYDFDIGQVVPAGQGADIEFTADRAIKAVDGSLLFGLDGSLLPTTSPGDAPPDPNDHEGVLTRDFSGVWRVDADGRWQGTLELTVDDRGNVDGNYISDETQSAYKVIGRADAAAHRIILEVELVNSHQAFEGYLWTTDKSTIAGITTLSEQKFGFVARRHAEPTAGDARPADAEPTTDPPATNQPAIEAAPAANEIPADAPTP